MLVLSVMSYFVSKLQQNEFFYGIVQNLIFQLEKLFNIPININGKSRLKFYFVIYHITKKAIPKMVFSLKCNNNYLLCTRFTENWNCFLFFDKSVYSESVKTSE